ncbi:MAG: DNA mismatch repair protein MutS [Bacteroidetes bacterium]|nr:MAG: DNA mismatch repair protein MutS [Bacteroidota bacterium]
MRQYNEIKSKHPDALLLFRVGDFYETFGQDAVKTSQTLDIILTKRANGSASEIELAGFPHHALDTYLPKLVRAGHRVAICDQLEDPKATKTIVKRGVTELVTPGVTLNDQILKSKSNNFLAAVHMGKTSHGVAFVDVSTGEFSVAQGRPEYIAKLLQSLAPSEVLYNRQKRTAFFDEYGERYYSYGLEDWVFQPKTAKEALTRHFQTLNLKGFGIEDLEDATVAAGAALHYLRETEHHRLEHITAIGRLAEDHYVWMDRFTIRNLELFQSNSPEGVSLIDILDHTVSPMGARLLKRWLALPLKDMESIKQRHDAVEFFTEHPQWSDDVRDELSRVNDLERLVSKLSTGRILPRELNQLGIGLDAIKAVHTALDEQGDSPLEVFKSQLNPLEALRERIATVIQDEPGVSVQKGGVIREGVHEELDEVRGLMKNGRDHLAKICEREQERTGIPSLKIAFNNVFGYYLEVRNTHKDKVPEEWVRKQTLVNAERYITEELKEYESKILGAEERSLALEYKIYESLIQESASYLPSLKINANTLAQLDVLLGFSTLALKHKYIRPEMVEGSDLHIEDGRHPVIEQRLKVGESYVANDVHLDREEQQIIMITGPNMSGKSALLRQTALIALIAQMGSFVPAKSASIGLLDKIFVRVGASDNISEGESTFMVEMTETASILNNLSENSLVLLDEIGRGTSTYDGISIAWAIAEYLHEHPTKAKTLFATHYHELNDMANTFERIANYNVSVKELDDDVIFLRKLVPGGSAHSFGIHVAGMAGMPKYVVHKAEKMLGILESSRDRGDSITEKASGEMQMSFFQLDDPLLEDLRSDIKSLDINSLTPVEALMLLNEMKKKLGE